MTSKLIGVRATPYRLYLYNQIKAKYSNLPETFTTASIEKLLEVVADG